LTTVFFAAAFFAEDFLTAAFVLAAFVLAVFVVTAFVATVLEVAAFEGAAFFEAVLVAAVFLEAGVVAVFVAAFVDAVFTGVAFAVLEAVFTGLASRATVAPCALFFPPTSLAAEPVDLPDADCCTAVFFATMAAAPSHIVILLANRAGTINRLPARGNGARHRFVRPAGPARQTCMRCAQLPAR
jgi:hypothetical protein